MTVTTEPGPPPRGPLSSNVSRLAVVLVPIVGAVIAAVLEWLQNVLGVDLQHYQETATGFVVAIVLGTCWLGAKWLEGRASFERAAAELEGVYRTGSGLRGERPGGV